MNATYRLGFSRARLIVASSVAALGLAACPEAVTPTPGSDQGSDTATLDTSGETTDVTVDGGEEVAPTDGAGKDDGTSADVPGETDASDATDSGPDVALASCDPLASNSIKLDCDQKNRLCEDGAAGSAATCGECVSSDYVEVIGEDYCEFKQTCVEDGECPAGKECVQVGLSDEPLCRPPICAAGEAFNRATAACKTCPACTGPGKTGKLWPVTDKNGNCVCETEPGFFWDGSSAGTDAFSCDADGDGWTTAKVLQVLASSSTAQGADSDDFSLLFNARCSPNSVDGFELVNEWGQTKAVTLSELGVVGDTVVLYESNRNDRGDATDPLPAYGTREFLPAEVNSLTKACTPIDLNDNGTSDPNESQDTASGEQWQQVYNAMSYFIELHTAYVANGKLVIAARSRCEDDAFVLGYADAADEYWKSCSRRRPTSYDGNDFGRDFARFDCSAPTGGCVLPAPVAAAGTEPPPHGLCDNVTLGSDAWRGMGHHSQFQCVTVINSGTPSAGEVHLDDVYDASAPSTEADHINQCGLGADSGTLDCSVVSESLPSTLGNVVWVAKGFKDYGVAGAYEGGCIDEWVEWPTLCPAVSQSPNAGGQGLTDAFGKLECSCDAGYELDAGDCVNVDECDAGTDNCPANSTCQDIDGGFECECNSGYEASGDDCVDKNECAPGGGSNCFVGSLFSATCTNSPPGSFTCSCPPEFPGDGTTCSDLPTGGLVGHYPLNVHSEGNTTVLDESPAGNDGQVTYSFVEFSQDRHGAAEGAWRLRANPGEETYINLPFGFGSGQPFSIALWVQEYGFRLVQMGNDDNGPGLWSGDWSVLFDMSPWGWTGNPMLYSSAPNYDWTFYVLTSDGSNIKLYKDGVLVPNASGISWGSFATSIPGFSQMYIGDSQVQLDDIRIYNTVISQTAIDVLTNE